MPKPKPTIARRNFIKAASTTALGFTIVPRHVLGRGFVAPSDRLNLASIGAGGKGKSDILNAYNNGANQVVALCDVDKAMCAASIKNFPKAKFFNDFRKMLDEMGKDIDGITISAPDHIHGVAAMSAMQLGIHVYVQKPLTHNIYEARMLTEAAKKYKIVTQMGNQGASNPSQLKVTEWFDAGLIGTVHTVHAWTDRPVWPQGLPVPTDIMPLPESMTPTDWDMFIGPAKPVDFHSLYHPFKWRGWWNFGTGALGDMGCHLIDTPFRTLGLGYPQDVECSAGQIFTRDWIPEHNPEGCPISSSVKLTFGSTSKNKTPVKLYWTDGGIRPFHPDLIPAKDALGNENSANGVIMIGTKGIITCGTYGQRPQLYYPNGDKLVHNEERKSTNPYHSMPEWGHQVSWTDACKAGYNSKEHKALTSSFDYSGPLTETVLMGNLAIRSYSLGKKRADSDRMDFTGRKKLLWDGKNMKITNLKEANQFVKREYRKGWELI